MMRRFNVDGQTLDSLDLKVLLLTKGVSVQDEADRSPASLGRVATHCCQTRRKQGLQHVYA